MSATEAVQAGPTADQTRIASLETANRFLTKRNGDLAAKTRQASDWFSDMAQRALMGAAPPPPASLELCAAYFYDTAKFLPDLKPFDEPAAAGGDTQCQT